LYVHLQAIANAGIVDLYFIGDGYMTELAKDFDFEKGVFESLFGTYPIEQAIEMLQI
jgi:hypothetical protein